MTTHATNGERRPPETGLAPDDAALLRAHVAGDVRAFSRIVARHAGLLMGVAKKLSASLEDAEDAFQEALLSAHLAAANFRGGAEVRTWLYRIVVNACADQRRKGIARHRLVAGSIDLDDLPAPVEALGGKAAEDLAGLSLEQRELILAMEIFGFSLEEASRQLRISEGTAKSRRARARAALARAMGRRRTA